MYGTSHSMLWIGSPSMTTAAKVSAMGAGNRLSEDPLETLPGPVISGIAGLLQQE